MSIRAFILATPSQLKVINIEETFITNMLCDVTEVDEHSNSIGLCSRCTMRLRLDKSVDEFIIPTQWLRFINKVTDNEL